MYKFRKRTGYSFNIRDGEATITVIKPLSQEISHNGKYLVMYEDAHGIFGVRTLNKSEITSIYGISSEDLEEI